MIRKCESTLTLPGIVLECITLLKSNHTAVRGTSSLHLPFPITRTHTHTHARAVRLKCAPKRQNKEDVFINSVFTAFGFKYEGQSVNLEKEVISMEGSIRRMTAMMESQNGTIESMQHAMLMAAQRQEENMLRLQNEIASLKRTTRVS